MSHTEHGAAADATADSTATTAVHLVVKPRPAGGATASNTAASSSSPSAMIVATMSSGSTNGPVRMHRATSAAPTPTPTHAPASATFDNGSPNAAAAANSSRPGSFTRFGDNGSPSPNAAAGRPGSFTTGVTITRPISVAPSQRGSESVGLHGTGGGSKVGSFSSARGSHSSTCSSDSPLVLPLWHNDPDDINRTSTPSATRYHAQRVPSLTLPSTREHDEATVSPVASPVAAASPVASASSSSSAPPAGSGSPQLRPTHFHSSLPTSVHNPAVQLNLYRERTGSGAVRGLDDDEEIDSAPLASPSPTSANGPSASPLSPSFEQLHSSSQPIPISWPAGHFTQSVWAWKHIDYLVEHNEMLADFFRAIETHSAPYVHRLANPVSVARPALMPLATSRGAPSASADAPATVAPVPPAPTYAPDFVPHRLESLTLIAVKELLRKTKIINEGLGAKNPTEKLLAHLLTTSGTVPSSEGSTRTGGAQTARQVASAAFSFLSSSSSPASTPALNVIPGLHTLDVRMGIDGVTLADALKRNQTLTHLSLAHNVISDRGCAGICRSLHQHPLLKTLDLSQNILYPSSAAALRDMLLYNRTLSHLDVSINKLGSEGVATLMEALGGAKQNRSLIKDLVEKGSTVTGSNLPISSPSGSTAAAAAGARTSSPTPASPPSGALSPASPRSSITSPSFVPAFSINQSLATLDLSNNRIGSSIEALCSALVCANSQLRDLRLCLNDIGDTGASYLALALRHPHCPLRVLNLADNCIGPSGCKTLMASLEYNSTLTRLDMSWNSLGQSGLGEGPKSVGKLLSVSSSLRELVLTSNSINEVGVRAIAQGWGEQVARGTSALQLLDLSVNAPGTDGVRDLVQVIVQPHCRLSTLILNRCSIVDDAVPALAQALTDGLALRRVMLQGNHQIRGEACALLLAAYARSSGVIELDIEDAPSIVRDESLGAIYRRARGTNFARLLESVTDLPLVLGTICAEYCMDLRKKAFVAAAPASPRDD